MPYGDYAGRVKEYQAMYSAKYRQLHRAKLNARSSRYYSENTEEHIKNSTIWAKNNPEKRKISREKWRKNPENKPLMNAHNRKRKALNKRTSKFELNNAKNIVKMYELAHKKTQETGKKYHVDHIAPLQGKSVSGFNISGNLRVILAYTNQVKHNHYTARDEALIHRRMIKDWIADGVKFKLNKPKKKRKVS